MYSLSQITARKAALTGQMLLTLQSKQGETLMRTLIWTVATAGTAYVAWLIFRKSGDTPLQAGKRLGKAALSPMPVVQLASELQHAWADHHTTA